MKRKNRIFICLLAAALLVLTACGQRTAPQESVPAASTQGQEVQPPEQEADAPENTAPPEETEPTEDAAENSGALVIYFSATGSTEAVAGHIADALGADTYEITPAELYTSDDLNWRDESSRVTVEHGMADFRPALGGDLPDLEGHETIFLG